MNTKKILALLLSLGILSQMLFTIVYAKNDYQPVNNEEIDLLTLLDIIDPISEAVDLDTPVTRADFALSVGRLIGVDEHNVCSKRYYLDLPEDHWAVNTINTLTERGILSGHDGRFRPSDNISYLEAIVMLFNAVGFKEIATLDGGFPKGYTDLASSYDVSVKVADYSSLTFAETCSLIYDVLFVPLPEVNRVTSSGEHIIGINSDTNFLAETFDVYCIKGFVTSALNVSANALPACGRKEVRIDDVTYDNAFDDVLDYLGIKVCAYYRETDVGNEIFYMAPHKSSNHMVIDIHDFYKYDENTNEIYYTIGDTDKIRKEKLSLGVTIVKNAVNVSSDIRAAFQDLNEGTITLSSSKNTNEYDTVVIKNYEDIIVSSFNKNDQIIYDKITRGNRIEFDDIVYLRVSDTDGDVKSIDDIKKDMILSVCRSDRYCEIIMSENNVSGKVTDIDVANSAYSADSEVTISLDGVSYEIMTNCYTVNKNLLKIGQQIKLYLNRFGRGIFAETLRTRDYLYGYAIKPLYNEYCEYYEIKILTENGTIENLRFAEKATVNKKRCTSPDEVAENIELRTGKSKEQVVIYKLDEDGNITTLETAVQYGRNADNANLRVDKPLYSGYYYTQSKMMGESVLIGDNAVCFKVPEAITTSTKIEDYSVIDPSSLMGERSYTVESYKTDEDTLSADIVLIKTSSSSGGWFHNMVVVDKVRQIYNEEEDEIEQVADMWVNGNKVTYRAERKVSFDSMPPFFGSGTIGNATRNNLSAGDVLRIFINSEGEITNADLFYDASEETPNINLNLNSQNVWSWQLYIPFGYITDIKNGVAKYEYSYTDNGESKTLSGVVKVENVPILVADPSLKEFTVGSEADLDNAMINHSLVYFGLQYGATQSIYIIK